MNVLARRYSQLGDQDSPRFFHTFSVLYEPLAHENLGTVVIAHMVGVGLLPRPPWRGLQAEQQAVISPIVIDALKASWVPTHCEEIPGLQAAQGRPGRAGNGALCPFLQRHVCGAIRSKD